jgi:hypothetical protein
MKSRNLFKCLCVALAGLFAPGANALLAADCLELVHLSGFESSPGPCAPPATYWLLESTPAVTLWTAPAARKVQSGAPVPANRLTGLHAAAARNEFEPVVLLVESGAGELSASVQVAPFADLGPNQRIELALAHYEANGWPENLEPLDAGGNLTLAGDVASQLWITLYVPPDAPAGFHTTSLQLVVDGQDPIDVPLRLYVFDFSLPDTVHFRSQFNIAMSEPQHDLKQLLFEHRLTPKAATWPTGYTYAITWDSPQNPERCQAFWDEATESEQFGIWALGPRYVLGQGWNGVGFPDVMLFQFPGNSQPRPDPFCGEALGDHFGSDAYNEAWAAFLAGLDGYLGTEGMREKTYYYVMNEPQGPADYDLAAHLCRLTRAAAPGLRIAISEEPKPQIAEHPQGACGYDIWLAHAGSLLEPYARIRQAEHGESLWLYSLPQDAHPLFNPTVTDRMGMDVRIVPWVAWRYRSRGWAYYDGDSFFTGRQPGVRAELLREGFEDYEYLYLANGGQHPSAGVAEPGDIPALSVAKTLYSWTRDADAFMALRYRLGLYLEGRLAELPRLRRKGQRPRDAYYINFQDPAGNPLDDPLFVDGKTYMKIGWQAYDAGSGYGWLGPFVGNPGVLLYGYLGGAAGYSEVEKSYLYDDFGRLNLFEFELENGLYEVTVAVNRAGIGHADRHNVTLEGAHIVDDEQASDLIVRTQLVELLDGRLSLEIGGRSAADGEYAYTFLAYMDIVPVD